MSDPKTKQRIFACLSYDDAPAAIEHLCNTFGFIEKYRLPMPDGRLGHAEIAFDGQVVTLASAFPEMNFVSPKSLSGTHSQLTVYVDDVDAHFAKARAAGATIVAEPEDQFHGSRMYRAVDTEGHRWIFAQQLREVSPDEMRRMIEAGATGE